MKIPSQFNEDSLYSRPQRRAETMHDWRRLIRLGMGLVLVLVVMRQAAKPRLYEPFFGAAANREPLQTGGAAAARSGWPSSAVAPGGSGAEANSGAEMKGAASAGGAPVAVEIDPEMRADAGAIVALIPPRDQAAWLASLLRIRRQQAIPQFSVLATGWTVRLEELSLPPRGAPKGGADEPEQGAPEQGADERAQGGGEQASPRLETWRALIDRIASDPVGFRLRDAASPREPLRVDALIAALDAAAAERVAKAGVWQAEDRDALYRYLDEARYAGMERAGMERAGMERAGMERAGIGRAEMGRQPDAGSPLAVRTSAPRVGVLPLLQQPEVYLDRRVAFSGTVARVEKHAASPNAWQLEEYWHLWLRPLDGADRPLLAVVSEVPPAVAGLVAATRPIDDGPALLIQGRFLKRLAYRSGVGADLAPVIVGRVVMGPAEGDPAAGPEAAQRLTPSEETSRVWTMVAIALLIGVGLASVIMWRTMVLARRSRQIRLAGQKDPGGFLDEIGRSHSDPPPQDDPAVQDDLDKAREEG